MTYHFAKVMSSFDDCEEKHFQIIVNTLSGESVILCVEPNDTILDIKRSLSNVLEKDINHLYLVDTKDSEHEVKDNHIISSDMILMVGVSEIDPVYEVHIETRRVFYNNNGRMEPSIIYNIQYIQHNSDDAVKNYYVICDLRQMKYAIIKSFTIREPIPGKKWMKWDIFSKNSKLPSPVFEVFSTLHSSHSSH